MTAFSSKSFSSKSFSVKSFDLGVSIIVAVQFATLDIDAIVYDTLINTDVIHQSLIDVSPVGTDALQYSAALTNFRDAVVRSSGNTDGEIIP